MDPNKIHIDELVRQRLQGGEEEPRPGAWITMRELLDGQMPTGRPIGGLGWGTTARWTTGLVLLTVLAGGYGAMEIRRESSKPLTENVSARTFGKDVASTSKSISLTPVSNGQQAVVSTDGISKDNTALSIAEATTARSTVETNRTAASASAFHSNAHSSFKDSRISAAKKGGATNASLNNATSQATPANTMGNSPQASTTPASSSKSVASSSRRNRRATLRTAMQQKKVLASNTASTKDVAPAPEKPMQPTRRRTSGAVAKKTENAQQNAHAESAPVLASASRASTLGGTSARRNTRRGYRTVHSALDSAKVQVQRDTLRPIRIAQRYFPARGARAGRYIADTTAFEPIVIEKQIPVAPVVASTNVTEGAITATRTRRGLFARKIRTKATTNSTVIATASSPKATPVAASAPPVVNPAAVMSLAASAPAAIATETLVPLSSLKVSSTKNTKLQYSAQEQIQDAMRKARFAFGQMRLYTGVTGGFNASVGGTSMGGFHAGLFGLLAISDHWSAGIEGKFVQRFNRGTELQDPYFQYRAASYDQFSTPDGEAYKVYRVTTDSFQHYYKLSTLESVEMPVYARYSFRRFHGFAGANLTFGLGVKNMERIERFAGRESNRRDTMLATASYTPPANTTATVSINDFGPRFGLGYTAGLGYQASPAVLVDVRMTQLVWDNRSNTPGGLRVSQTFYRVPSLQLSIGYRFSQQSQRR